MKDIQEILTTEKNASQICLKAEKDAEKIVAKARQDAQEFITNQKIALDLANDDAIEARSHELEKEQQQIHTDAKRKVTRLQTAAAKKIANAEKLVLKTVLAV
ncbi:TPA: hypothetical protein HA278_07795 [Candidatus Woesearchaeota archaeon]|nr:hypothetical protein [archaeon]HIJ11934.1 hypothetical protein [Candidatus Woesearchaeota archaeon]